MDANNVGNQAAVKIPFNIKYIITGREDGRWVVEAFDRNENKIGTRLVVSTPSEAWKIWLLLNGYHYAEPFAVLETDVA